MYSEVCPKQSPQQMENSSFPSTSPINVKVAGLAPKILMVHDRINSAILLFPNKMYMILILYYVRKYVT
jgi:hypothetical protein